MFSLLQKNILDKTARVAKVHISGFKHISNTQSNENIYGSVCVSQFFMVVLQKNTEPSVSPRIWDILFT